jgi:6-phosphogluconolactonase
MDKLFKLGLAGPLLGAALAVAAMSPSPVAAATYAYVGNAASNDISVLQLNLDDGSLSEVEKVTVPGIDKPGGSMPMALSPDHRFLYAGERGAPLVVASFRIDQLTGKLTHLGNAPLADSMPSISTDRSGRFLLGASYGGNKISVNPIGPQGFVQPPQQVVITEPKAHMILADPANRFVFASNLGGDIVMQERFDAATGMLTPNDPPSVSVKEGAGPRHLVFHPNGRFLYLICELDGSIFVFHYDAAAGRLTQKQATTVLPPDFTGTPWAADIHVTPNGRFLYGSERTSSTIRAFSVDPATGGLTAIESYPTEKQPRAFNIDPTGHYLLAVGELSTHLAAYRIDQDSGKLTPIGGIEVGKNPNWVEIVTLP